jgi:hypothetical protein
MIAKNKLIEAWWDSLNNKQQDYLENRFYKENKKGINTLEKVIHCYENLNEIELLELNLIHE